MAAPDSRTRPSNAEIREAAERLGFDAERALETLAQADLVHLDRDVEIAEGALGQSVKKA